MTLRRFCLLLAGLLACVSALAATVAERSPFAQGHWWNPQRAGTGFDIFNTNGTVALVWYTYDEAGRPIWYNAIGAQADLGKAFPLWRERWSGGHWSGYTVVGSVQLNVRHPEGIDLDWTIGDKRGTWSLQPLVGSGVISEIDHTGHWYDPSQSGWGFTVTEQGDVLGAVLYTYDAAGEPTWLAGFNRGIAPRVELFATTGSCPWCVYQASTTRSVGFVNLDFAAETALTWRGNPAVTMAAGVNADGARAVQLSRPASTRSADRRLASFDSDTALKTYLDAGMLAVPTSLVLSPGDFSPAPAGGGAVAFSTTNLVEQGVDEADLVKTDGQRIYTFNYSNGVRQPALRVARVDNGGAALTILGTVALSSPSASGASAPIPIAAVGNAGLYLAGEKLVSVTGQPSYSVGWYPNGAWAQGKTSVEVFDTTGALPVSRWRAEIDGYVVTSRRIGDRLYIASRFVPYIPGFVFGATAPGTVAMNRTLLANTSLASMLPQVKINGGSGSALVGTGEVYVPPQGSRTPIADMILVTAIDLGAPRIAQALAIMGSIDTVYASTSNLYVASSRQQLRAANGTLLPVEPNPFITDIHQIALGDRSMSIVASAAIEGYLDASAAADQGAFRLSEYQGRLRVVTSSRQMWGSTSTNRLTILEPSTVAPGLLRTDSYLPNAQRPQPLGNPGELLYATRFVADRLYAVTFRMIDPLYLVDVSAPADPRIAGALTVPGFTEYLHPLPNGLLLGFGKDAVPASIGGDAQAAWYQGLLLALYDVREATTLREMQRIVIGKRGSNSALLTDHHAFSMLTLSATSSTIGIPARIHDGAPVASPSYFYPWVESGLARFELQGSTAADARLVRLPSLITQSAATTSQYTADSATTTGRSILFGSGTVYIGDGQFWTMDATGAKSGPY
jgi:uncharacterized secreted protein with C-terminal beta-propeller domain